MRLTVIESSLESTREKSLRVERLIGELESNLRGTVRGDVLERGLYATDASPYDVMPIAVVAPRDASDLTTAMEICSSHSMPVLPRGAGTSLGGQTVNTAVVIDFTPFMNRVVSIDPGARTARVQPGLVLDDFKRSLQPLGLGFGPDVSTSTHATLGGMIGNASAGAYSLVHGMTDEHVLAIEGVLADGTCHCFGIGDAGDDPVVARILKELRAVVEPLREEIEARFPKVRRNVGGYRFDDLLAMFDRSGSGSVDQVNLGRFLSGTEGSLAVTAEATVRLVEPSRGRALMVAAFASVTDACGRVESLVEAGPAAVELMDAFIIDAAARQPVYAADVDLLPTVRGARAGAILFVEFHAEDQAIAEEAANSARRRAGLDDEATHIFLDPKEQARLWAIRTTGLGLISKVTGSVQPMAGLEDCGVPIERLAEFQPAFEALIESHGWSGVFYAHASVGLLHVRPRIDLSSEVDRSSFRALREETLELVLAHGGTISGEHGDGRIRTDLVHRMYGERIVEGFQAVKTIFDPRNLLNPGSKVVAGDPLADLRVDQDRPSVATGPFFFRWPEGGPLAEARACNGNALCRRIEGGAMCPSYRALRDERHSTRGRANALRLALDGRLAGDESVGEESTPWNRPDVEEALSLCLSCKACRHECPSNVDLAKLKSEYLAQSYAEGRRKSIRTRVLGRAGLLLKRAARIPRLSRALASIPGADAIIARVLGLDPTRSLPRPCVPAARAFTPTAEIDAPVVLLLGDCFSTSLEPGLQDDAERVLDAFGYRVRRTSLVGCCGRPQISAGLLGEARSLVEQSAGPLASELESSGAIAMIMLEPSCLSAIHEEWRELESSVPSATARRLAEETTSIEMFLEQRWDTHPRCPRVSLPDSITVHPHCHAKVDRGVFGRLLDRLGAVDAEVLDSGCCGLAGSFGYVAENAELSRRIFEQSLGDTVDRSEAGPLVAAGTSCRHQCNDLAEVCAIHPATLIAQAMQSVARDPAAP
ncbi:MAG: FAD-binding and (Fe-S)-binding domain-containing protein [Planctomycetota bacterium]|jgi:FAD/FMN-containing dehydrogenase/Fe-S oxidoreductase|nr:FAD-binding and (Fe-S)-binding domain-containing protein [Planctomycetota bacterium]